MTGFVKLQRKNALDLMEHKPKAFLLLTLIALRAKRTKDSTSIHCLGINQAYIGDSEKIGLTRSEYRTAMKYLSKAGFADFKGISGQGTIATLLNKTVFDINADHETTYESPPKPSMENDSRRPINNHNITSAQPRKRYPMTTQQPLTKKEEKEKETTTGGGGRMYKCLEEETRLTTENKQTLMRKSFPEERIELALKFSRIEPIRKSLMGTIIWHCQQKIPPEPNNTCKITVEQRAWEFNKQLEDNGYLDLVEKNIRSIPQGYIFIPMPNGSTTITLNTTLDGFEKDLAECIELIFNRQETFTKSNTI